MTWNGIPGIQAVHEPGGGGRSISPVAGTSGAHPAAIHRCVRVHMSGNSYDPGMLT